MSTDRLSGLLALAAVGAVVVIVRFLPVGVELGGVALIGIAAALTASTPIEPSAPLRWWRLIAYGGAMCAAGVPLALLLDTIGGLLAGAGGALVIVGVAFGFPGRTGAEHAPDQG